MPRQPQHQIQPGERFGRLATISLVPGSRKTWLCMCDCGNEKQVRRDHLWGGKVQSCGCLRNESSRERLLTREIKIGTTHGASDTPAYSVWLGMRQRCKNPKSKFFRHYGGRGIRICERWAVFDNFLADMGQPGPGETLDRIDNDGHYGPDNCRWATRRTQQNNRRTNVRITIDHITRTIAEWARISGVHRNTIQQRIDSGVTGRGLIEPVKYAGLMRLTSDQVQAIKNNTTRTQRSLAREFGVSDALISAVKHGKARRYT